MSSRKRIFLCFLLFFLLLAIVYISFVNKDDPTSVMLQLLKTRKSWDPPESRQGWNRTVKPLSSEDLLQLRGYSSNRFWSVLNGTKKILLVKNSWLNPHRLDSWLHPYATGRNPFISAGCRVSNCLLTTDKTQVKEDEFDAYVVHVPTQKKRWELKNRKAHQVFIMLTLEPPPNFKNLDSYENYFNWTVSYLDRSDFVFKYGEIVPLESAPKSTAQVAQYRQNVRESGVDPSLGKSRLVAWAVSNCKANSNRQEYVKILSKWIQVDIFSKKGRCGGKGDCPKKNAKCSDHIERTYKFYLSFENSICQDYVTEKVTICQLMLLKTINNPL